MAGICDRCNERTSRLISIAQLPEMASVIHLGYRQVCEDCYDDLLEEAKEARDWESRDLDASFVEVSIAARVEGNTSHLDPFSDEMTIEAIGPSGLRLSTTRELDTGTVLKVIVPSYGLEVPAIVETVSRDSGQSAVELKLGDQSEGWDRLWKDHSSGAQRP